MNSVKINIMRTAWKLYREQEISFSDALKLSWGNHKKMQTNPDMAIKFLQEGVVDFTYRKKDGSLRKARGTMNQNLFIKPHSKTGAKSTLAPNQIAYWDFTKEQPAYRSFLKENFVEFKLS